MANFLDDYEPVEDRLRDFWADHPTGRVVTVLVSQVEGDYIVRAEVFADQDGLPTASGLAHDSEAQLPPSMKASALEVCETSAIGRALANMGYAAKGKRPSREEMSKASPAGGPAGTAGEPTTATSGQAGGTTSTTEGEAVVVEAPGDGLQETQPSPGVTKDAPGPPHYALEPSACDHLRTTGSRGLLRPRKSPRGPVCPRCGLSYITVTEGTAADLGAA